MAIGCGVAELLAADVTPEDVWAAIAGRVDTEFGRADFLVHTAGIYPAATLAK